MQGNSSNRPNQGEITLSQAVAMADKMVERDGYLNAFEWALKVGMLVVNDKSTITTAEQPVVVKYDGTFEDEPTYEMFVNEHAEPKQRQELMVGAVRQFVMDRTVIAEAGIFVPQPLKPTKRS